MNKTHPTAEPASAWQRTVVSDLAPPVVPFTSPVPPRPPMPLRSPAIQGLDVRELESESVFDRLFGDEAPPAR